MQSKEVQCKFFRKTKATRGCKLEYAYSRDTGLGAQHRTALIACELARYNIDIAALSETRLPDEGSLTEMGTGYTFFWMPVAFMALDMQLGLHFCRATNNHPLQ